jgi:hypothetical protein
VSNVVKPLLIRRPSKREWAKIRADMRRNLLNVGPYQHNIISLTLRGIATEYGTQIADDVVDEFRLDRLFGIQQEIPAQIVKALKGE